MDWQARASQMTTLEVAALLADYHRLGERVDALQQQLDWLKRQLFGVKSERRLGVDPARQLGLGEGFETAAGAPARSTA